MSFKDALIHDANSSIKVRLASPDERTSYQNASDTDTTASPDGIKLVYLVNLAP